MPRTESPQERWLRTVTERDWQIQVEQLLDLAGFSLRYHTWNSRHSPKGFPDLVATRIRPDGWTLLFVELKRETGQLSAAQQRWLADLSTMAALVNRADCWVRMIVGVFRPRDADRLWQLLQEEESTR